MPSLWFLIAGVLLIGVALSGSVLKRLPLTAAMFYLTAGALLGPWGAGLLRIDPVADASLLERLTEIAVIISLFTAGLKLRLPPSDRRWRRRAPARERRHGAHHRRDRRAGGCGAGLPLGAAVLLGALLAPTDPVLASDVQVDARARCRTGPLQPDRRSRPE